MIRVVKVQLSDRWPQAYVWDVLGGSLFCPHLSLGAELWFVRVPWEPSLLLSPQGKRLFTLPPGFSPSCRLLLLVTQGRAHSGDRKDLRLPQGQTTFASTSLWEIAYFAWALRVECFLSHPMPLKACVLNWFLAVHIWPLRIHEHFSCFFPLSAVSS